MNDPAKTPLFLAREANEEILQEQSAAFQEHFPVLDEEQLEEVAGGGFPNCCTKPRTSSPPKTTPAGDTPLHIAVGERDHSLFVQYVKSVSSNRPEPEGLDKIKNYFLNKKGGI